MQETEGRPVHGPSSEQGVSGWKEQASSKAKDLAAQAETTADAGKDQVANRVGEVAHAVRHAGQEDENLAPYAEAIGSQLQNVADYIQHHDVRDMLRTAGDFAHRQPALFLGGAFTIGLIAARFLKSSSNHEDEELTEHDIKHVGYGEPGSYGTPERPYADVWSAQRARTPSTSARVP